ncbi:MAG TPA: DUF3084 domain-containing protein [Bacillota bacterium]|mgnify:FL=1|nr:DUF3084 domain-containing protein [Bacillota bacterium]HOH10204.1 DUF3084 domain-containing protein [Bacillota bacterium]HOS50137.1 DUF3084 domain-containing protein [Bacillota bacterium]HPI01166.1 DUF3084 domain-containing protein [Bacillota bacterium]HPM63581.1 DUF3084 domain-containing protein [Bacillota bacterium]
MSGILLIAILAIVGGLVAIVGDRIGMRVGRKRLTLFGIRPKYTSIIITFLTGVLVVALTVVTLSLLSENVRIALFKIEELRGDLEQTASALEDTKKELSDKMSEADELTVKVQSIGSQYESLKADYNAIMAQLSKANTEKTVTARQLEELKKGLSDIQGKLSATEERLLVASRQVQESGLLLKEQQGEITKLSDERLNLESNISELQDTRNTLNEEVAYLEEQLNQLIQTSMLLIESKQASMTMQVIFYADQTILGSAIDCSQPIESIHQQINDFLIRVNDIAKTKGAGEVAGRQDGSALNFDEDNVLNAFQKVYSSKGKVIMRAVSPVNSWLGEPLWVSLHVFEDELVFFKGQVIASQTIDGSMSADKVQFEIIRLIEEVNAIGLAKGMVSDEEGRIGTFIKALQFTDAIIKVLEAGTKVRVDVIAERDIYRSESQPTMTLSVAL